MPAVSITIITLNEAERLPAALASAAWADEIVVLDSGSTDGTPDLARAAGAVVVVEAWRGYGAQKNRAAELARHDWIFNLDADERIDATLAQAVRTLPATPAAAVYRVRRRNRFAGVALRHWPWAWDEQRRLYDRHRTRFTAAAVHESLEPAGAVGRLPGVLDHETYRDWADYERRQRRYGELWADTARARGRQVGALKRGCDPAVTFLRHWLLRGYLLGGALGWRMSLAAARGTRLRHRLLAGQTP